MKRLCEDAGDRVKGACVGTAENADGAGNENTSGEAGTKTLCGGAGDGVSGICVGKPGRRTGVDGVGGTSCVSVAKERNRLRFKDSCESGVVVELEGFPRGAMFRTMKSRLTRTMCSAPGEKSRQRPLNWMQELTFGIWVEFQRLVVPS